VHQHERAGIGKMRAAAGSRAFATSSLCHPEGVFLREPKGLTAAQGILRSAQNDITDVNFSNRSFIKMRRTYDTGRTLQSRFIPLDSRQTCDEFSKLILGEGAQGLSADVTQ